MKISIQTMGCGLQLAVVGFYLAFMGWSSDYILGWFGKDVSFFWDMVIGFVGGTVTIPVAIIGKILEVCGVF